METERNEFYADLVKRLDYALKNIDQVVKEEVITSIIDVRETLNRLSKKPKLRDDVGQFTNITNNMAKIYAAKNHDYGNSFDKSLDKFGLVASVVRIGDKMNRIESLVQKKAMVQDESIRDTLLDMANYAIMTVMWMDNQHKSCNV